MGEYITIFFSSNSYTTLSGALSPLAECASSFKIQRAKLSLANTLKRLRLITSNIPRVAEYQINPAAVVSGVVDPTPPG